MDSIITNANSKIAGIPSLLLITLGTIAFIVVIVAIVLIATSGTDSAKRTRGWVMIGLTGIGLAIVFSWEPYLFPWFQGLFS